MVVVTSTYHLSHNIFGFLLEAHHPSCSCFVFCFCVREGRAGDDEREKARAGWRQPETTCKTRKSSQLSEFSYDAHVTSIANLTVGFPFGGKTRCAFDRSTIRRSYKRKTQEGKLKETCRDTTHVSLPSLERETSYCVQQQGV